ncbi:Mediator complex subunit 6 [Hyphodiscus hymeniophilus]|uniref:Mediator of RNA polymerase II transcription subunit 6 n=1 Tax=Hyphodiscus hymeniophilus TaxID=353542 RepID=A0A9P6VIX0_9HELO|nr:Mediator complex subunit 6 [Hyphodiscus hymeniophilus]
MAVEERTLDEIAFSNPEFVTNPFWGGIHTNSVLWYFSESPFFDVMSNNTVLRTQLEHNEQLRWILFNREAFEARLRTMNGVEFVVAEQPADQGPGGTGVWVIRKQMRKKRQGEEDEVSLLNTFHVVGDNIYMAPVAADLLGSRMLSITQRLNKFMSIAARLPDFSPALGHRYLPPPSSRLKAIESQLSQGSKEPTPLPDALQTSKKVPSSADINASNYLDVRLLEESLNITQKYGDEYMDENPVTGQPGDFHLSTTGRKDKDKLSVPVVKAPAPAASGKPSAPPTPLKTDIPPARKGSKSPRTPGMPKPKRRKSSKVHSAGGISPT